MDKDQDPIRIAIIGAGGFAAVHHAAIQTLEETGEFRLVATCDPSPELLASAATKWEFGRRAVRCYPDYLALLEAEQGALDLVTVPTPVPLHAEMHRACVERDLACYLEKPPTLDYRELEAMLDVEKSAARATQVGFNFIVEEPRQALKARIVAGEFGAVRRVGFLGLWPRSTTYYGRNDWAGRLQNGAGRLVLDSCIGNAMAHYVHNVHFWAGDGALFSWATADRIEAELYRAHAIEGFDTCFVRAVCENGVELQIGASHACAGESGQREWVVCERAEIHYVTHDRYTVHWYDGRTEEGPTIRGNLLRENFEAYAAYLRGSAPRPQTRLSDCRPFVELNDLVYVAAGTITDAAGLGVVRRVPAGDKQGGEYVVLEGVREALEAFAETGRFPSEQGISWGRPGGPDACRGDLPKLPEVIRQLADEGSRTPAAA